MFERYTDKAGRVISQARLEALAAGSGLIEAEHILLGLINEDEILLRILPLEAPEAIRVRIGRVRRFDQTLSTSSEMPLSDASKRVLEYSAEEAQRLGHQIIDCSHLTLGLLRIDDCAGVSFLRKCGINTDSYRSVVGSELEQALGHLVDWAAAHHVWLARALTEPKLVASGYLTDSWVSAQKYENYVWQEIVDLWAALNLLLVHVLAKIPQDKRDLECRIGAAKPIPLSKLIERYVEHCEGVVASILA